MIKVLDFKGFEGALVHIVIDQCCSDDESSCAIIATIRYLNF